MGSPAREAGRSSREAGPEAGECLGGAAVRLQRENLIVGSKDGAQPENMELLLTGLTEDVDVYWTKAFKDADLPEPQGRLRVDPGRQDRGERV